MFLLAFLLLVVRHLLLVASRCLKKERKKLKEENKAAQTHRLPESVSLSDFSFLGMAWPNTESRDQAATSSEEATSKRGVLKYVLRLAMHLFLLASCY